MLPPPGLGLKIILHMQKFQAKGLVILLLWPSISWFGIIFPEGHTSDFVKDHWIFKPFFLADNKTTSKVLKDKFTFMCIGLLVDFKGML